jgi:precorrin-6A/cobalt-precorrin-6A reductase
MRRVLILGGTTEARRLAERLAGRADLAVTVSLAGRTTAPAAQAVPVRVGSFGGVEGLARYLTDEHVDALIDATHPYAAIISANAAAAATATRVPLLAFRRAPWAPLPGDRWIEVADVAGAVDALGEAPRQVFLALGRSEIGIFARAPQHHYLVRSVEPVDPPLAVPHASYITGRGPFSEADDRALLVAHAIDVVVAKNSGGAATYGKIAAARALGVPVVLLRHPSLPEVPAVETVEEAVAWLDHASALRGV